MERFLGIPYAPTSSWYLSRCRLAARGESEEGAAKDEDVVLGAGLKLGAMGGLHGKRGGWRPVVGWVRASCECCDCFGASLGSLGGVWRTGREEDDGWVTVRVESEFERTRGNAL